jgi:beta-aspartyl-peptidase (threonine type)
VSISIAVHGGAGPARPGEDGRAQVDGCLAAARAGQAVLLAGGSALEAVEVAVRALEDDPLFNAGTGACLNLDGEVELDAAVMDGATLAAGGVTCVRGVKNPITLARAVMTHTPHVLLAGPGAHLLARKLGIPEVPPQSLVTDAARRRWAQARAQGEGPEVTSGGTVGAVARDARGHVAAGTSTGGMLLKWPGRVGDSPIPGAGVYADDAGGAASATGHGEVILRAGLCREVVGRMARGEAPQAAADAAVAALGRFGGGAGLIVVAPDGEVAWAHDTERMARAAVLPDGRQTGGFFG